MKPPQRTFPSIYLAEVINNTDPDDSASGRVQVRVWPMMLELPTAVLPWAAPAFSLFEGGASGIGAFTVPEMNSRVYLFFAAGDIRSPVYFAAAPGKSDGPAGRKPNLKIWKSRSGHVIEIDDTSGEERIVITHRGGLASIEIDSAGKVIVTGATDIELAGGGLPATGKLVTTLHACAFTGGPHPAGSTNVKASL